MWCLAVRQAVYINTTALTFTPFHHTLFLSLPKLSWPTSCSPLFQNSPARTLMSILPSRTPKKSVMSLRLWALALPTVSLKNILDSSMCASEKSRLRLMMWLRVSSLWHWKHICRFFTWVSSSGAAVCINTAAVIFTLTLVHHTQLLGFTKSCVRSVYVLLSFPKLVSGAFDVPPPFQTPQRKVRWVRDRGIAVSAIRFPK